MTATELRMRPTPEATYSTSDDAESFQPELPGMSRKSFLPADRRWRKPSLMLAAAIGAGATITAARPLLDVDLFWHTRVGSEILSGSSIFDAGHGWSFAPVADNWVSTQWLVEVLFAWLHTVFGWNGLIGFEVVTLAFALGAVAFTVFQRTRAWAGLLAFCLSAFSLVIFAQERPQQISFALLPIVGWMWLRAIRDARAPRWWLILPLAAVWANCHGLWIMLPIALGMAAIGRIVEYGKHDRCARALFGSTLAAIVGGCITPLGPANLLSPIRFAGATDHILEWDPTNMLAISSLGLTLSAAVLVVAWARGKSRPSIGEVLYAVAIIAMGMSAGRNVTPAVLMLAPLLAWRASVAFRGPRRRLAPEGLVKVSVPAAVVLVLAGLCLALTSASSVEAIAPGAQPVKLVTKIAQRPGTTHVLNGYNVSGLVLWYARPDNGTTRGTVLVGIDGRADRYGGAYIDRYMNMQQGKPGWDATVDELRPDVALLEEKDALIPLLQSRGWQITGTEAHYVLLEPQATSNGGHR